MEFEFRFMHGVLSREGGCRRGDVSPQEGLKIEGRPHTTPENRNVSAFRYEFDTPLLIGSVCVGADLPAGRALRVTRGTLGLSEQTANLTDGDGEFKNSVS